MSGISTTWVRSNRSNPKICSKIQVENMFNVYTRSTALAALAFRGQETLWSLCARLRSDVQPHSSVSQRHRAERHCGEHAAYRRPHGATFNREADCNALN